MFVEVNMYFSVIILHFFEVVTTNLKISKTSENVTPAQIHGKKKRTNFIYMKF